MTSPVLKTKLIAAVDFTHGPCFKQRAGYGELVKTAGDMDRGFVINSTSAKAEMTLTESMRVVWPITVACVSKRLGANTNLASLFGMTHNNTNGSPYGVCVMQFNNTSGNIGVIINSGGSFVNQTTTYSTRLLEWDVLVVQQTVDGMTFWANGVVVTLNTVSRTNPTYAATALLAAGTYTGISGRNTNHEIAVGYMWNAAIGEIASKSLGKDWYAPIRKEKRRSYKSAAAPPASTANNLMLLGVG